MNSDFPIELNDPDLFREEAFINGNWVKSASNFEVRNPANGQILAQVPDLAAEETRGAIMAAREAFHKWKDTTPASRARILKKWFELLMANKTDLGRILTLEQGKPLKEAIGEISYGASFVEWYAEEARRSYGDIIPPHARDKRILALRQPLGVVGAITPWNFPNAMIARKVAPAIAAGCTVVVKPAESTPLSALAMARLAERAGIPPGVLNIVTTDKPEEVGRELTSNPWVRKLSFTGSTEVGKILMRQSADTVKKLSLELGGNAPFIVFDDADLDSAVDGAVASKYRNAGQTCICANRIYVQDKVYDEFYERLKVANDELIIGDGLAEDTDIGPLINSEALDKINELLSDAGDQGAEIHRSSARLPVGELYCSPVIVTGLNSKMRIHNEEIFGPVSPIYKFRTEEEVIQMANDTRYGLASYFFGRDHARIWRVAEALDYGMVGINTGLISTPVAPFGGVKESGFGREGSKYGMDEFMQIKYLCWDIGNG